MGQSPSEYYGCKCFKCGKDLPPCTSFDNFCERIIHGHRMYVYNGGQYYREVGIDNAYQCPSCFEMWQKKKRQHIEQIRQREEQMRREREEQIRRREEQMRREREEQKRRREEQMRHEREEQIRGREEQMRREREEQIRRREEQMRREREEQIRRREEQMRREREEQKRRREEQMRREREEQIRGREEQMRREREEQIRRREEQMRREREEQIRRREELIKQMEEQIWQVREEKGKQEEKEAEQMNLKQRTHQDTMQKESQTLIFQNDIPTPATTDEQSLVTILCNQCNLSGNFSLSDLTSEELGKVISALEDLLFDTWTSDPPSSDVLKHAQVLITELCLISMKKHGCTSPEDTSDHVHYLVEEICESNIGTYECFILTQALFLNLLYIFGKDEISELKILGIAAKLSENKLSTDEGFILSFLEILALSLGDAVERMGDIFVLSVEKKCFHVLISTLENYCPIISKSVSTLLSFVESGQWTPSAVLDLLANIITTHGYDVTLQNILQQVQFYAITPSWKDDSGNTLTDILHQVGPQVGPQEFLQIFQEKKRCQDKLRLDDILHDLKSSRYVEDEVITKIQQTITTVQSSIENSTAEHKSLPPVNIGCSETLSEALFHFSKVIFERKGWWPTLDHMVRWCELVLTDNSHLLEKVGSEEEPCVTAMVAAMHVLMGNKVDIVLESAEVCKAHMKEWSEFYRNVNSTTNITLENDTNNESDIVYTTLDKYLSHHLLHFSELNADSRQQCSRAYIIDRKCLTKENITFSTTSSKPVQFIADYLKSLTDDLFIGEKEEEIKMFLGMLIQTLKQKVRHTPDSSFELFTVFNQLSKQHLIYEQNVTLKLLNAILNAITHNAGALPNVKEKCCRFFLTTALQMCCENTLSNLIHHLVTEELWTAEEILTLLKTLPTKCYKIILRLFFLLDIYQVSPKWKDNSDQNIFQILGSPRSRPFCLTESPQINHLEQQLKEEHSKSIDAIVAEIRELNKIDPSIIENTHTIVQHVQELITSDEIKILGIKEMREISNSNKVEHLQLILASLCKAVHDKQNWWPRLNQMISWCLLVLSNHGQLLEIGTGEGKSCVIAMFAALQVLKGNKVDIVSSSSVLCQRDANDWAEFYKHLGITVDTNNSNADGKKCYQKDIVYGTLDAFAGDYLRETFEMKETRSNRAFQCIIIDEVDSLLLDQATQITYLSSEFTGAQHLNVILSMIWGHVSQYGTVATESQYFVRGPVVPLHKAVFDAIDTEGSNIEGPVDILRIAEENNIVPEGFTEQFCNGDKEQHAELLKSINKEAMFRCFEVVKEYLPYNLVVYEQDEGGILHCVNSTDLYSEDIQDLHFLVLGNSLCCQLYDSEESLYDPISGAIREKLHFSPCEENDAKVKIPGYLKTLVEEKMSIWIKNAFLALRLREDTEFVVDNEFILPVDFKSTGIIEMDKKWGDGLQQFLEMKHKTKLSPLSIVTNYISNASYIKMYHGSIYGTTGTLGDETDAEFFQKLLPNLSGLRIPPFSRKKLFESHGLVTHTTKEWKDMICKAVKEQISPTSWRKGRAALVICESIKKAEEIEKKLSGNIPGELILYARSDKPNPICKELNSGDVIIATNLAGRGTDIKVTKEVNESGGLFVVLSFLSENTRVERQAIGRTARKGSPGSAKIIICTDHIQESLRHETTLEDIKSKRDQLAEKKVEYTMAFLNEVFLQDELFTGYCKILADTYNNTKDKDKSVVVAVLNEYWGIWLQTKSQDIKKLKRVDLLHSLQKDMETAKKQCLMEQSPLASIYHYIKFGNNANLEGKWDESIRLYEIAMEKDPDWAAIAFYNHAFCILHECKEGYIDIAMDDLSNGLKSIRNFAETWSLCQFLSSVAFEKDASTGLEQQYSAKLKVLSALQGNIEEAMQKLSEIKSDGKEASVCRKSIFCLKENSDEEFQYELDSLHMHGLRSVFTVTEKIRFSWGGLAVFCLGLLQIVAGVLLTALTYGALASIGIELITEGIGDCIYGIEAMVTGKFSWKEWGVQKVVSIVVSLLGFGIGKLLVKGFKAAKAAVKGGQKIIKTISKSFKGVGNSMARKGIKSAIQYTGKAVVEQGLHYLVNMGEDELLKLIISKIKAEISSGVINHMKTNVETEPLGTVMDSIILSHVTNQEYPLSTLLQNDVSKHDIIALFKNQSSLVLEPFYSDLSWQNMLSKSTLDIVNQASSHVKNFKTKCILEIFKAIYFSALLTDSLVAVDHLSKQFKGIFCKSLEKFMNDHNIVEVRPKDLSKSDQELLKSFKGELAEVIASQLVDVLVDVFHQKFSSHLVNIVKKKLNTHLRAIVKTDKTLNKLRKVQDSRYISLCPQDGKNVAVHDVQSVKSYAEKLVVNPEKAGTLLEVRVLAETYGTEVKVLHNKNETFKTLQVVSPTNKSAAGNIYLIYKPKSDTHPRGHYNVMIDNKEVHIQSTNNNCLFHAFARGLNPGHSEDQIYSRSNELRSQVSEVLHKNPNQWAPFVKRRERLEGVRGGDWFLFEGGAPERKKLEETEQTLRDHVGSVHKYKRNRSNNRKAGCGHFIEADHQPPVKCIIEALQINKDSKLAKAFLAYPEYKEKLNKIWTDDQEMQILIDKMKKSHGSGHLTVNVPKNLHRNYPSTKYKECRTLIATAMAKDDVVGTFKYIELCSIPTDRFISRERWSDFKNQNKQRVKIFENSFETHAKEIVQKHFKKLRRTDAKLMTPEAEREVLQWIENKKYKDQNDPHWRNLANILRAKKGNRTK